VVSTTVALQSPDQKQAAPPWSLATRIAFRLSVVYFGLYCLSTQIITSMLPVPGVDFPDPSGIPPLRQVITFTATHVFHHKAPLVFTGSGSGDKTVDFVLLFCLLVVSVLATALWSLLDRRRTSYSALHKWFWLFFRFALAGQMLSYGFAKAIPLQMSFPGLPVLLEPFGNMSPMGVLWSSVGASPPYEIAVGCLELLGGLLLFIPRTATLGALIALVDMSYVFLLNMTYDVPVKLLSLNLILLALVLLAPEFRRLTRFFLLHRATEPAPPTPLFRSSRANRIAYLVLALFALCLIATNLWGARQGWKQYGPGAPKPALYGIWDVDQFTLDGQSHPPLLTDNDRWRRIVFDYTNFMLLDHMNETPTYCTAITDTTKHTLALTQRGVSIKSSFTFARPTPDQLILDGTLAGHPAHIELHRQDPRKFLLVSRGFHWLQEYPYNR
jgi:uncharacterized membrane protein YphA (DoxX/SURF4 family)